MLTGRTRYRTSWRGKQILQVQYEKDGYGHWRDATEHDLSEIDKVRAHQLSGAPYIPQAMYRPDTGSIGRA